MPQEGFSMTETPEPTPEQTPEPQAAPEAKKKPWDDGDFNPEKAWNLIEGLRSDKEKLSAREVLTPDMKQKLDEYQRLEEASKTELEKAQTAAQAAQGDLSRLRNEVVSAKIEAALTGVVPDPAVILDDLNLAKFISDDGGVNGEAVAALRDKYAALAPAKRGGPAPNPAQGASANGPAQPPQLSRQDLAGMTPDAINEARKAGRLNDVMGIPST